MKMNKYNKLMNNLDTTNPKVYSIQYSNLKRNYNTIAPVVIIESTQNFICSQKE